MKKNLLLFLTICLLSAAFATTPENRGRVFIEVCRRTEPLIRLSPNPTYNGTLTIHSKSKEPLHFYVFDVEATMVFHALLLPGAQRTVTDLKAGYYSYDVFRNDESIERGKIKVLAK